MNKKTITQPASRIGNQTKSQNLGTCRIENNSTQSFRNKTKHLRKNRPAFQRAEGGKGKMTVVT